MDIAIEAWRWLRGVFGDPAVPTVIWVLAWAVSKASRSRVGLSGNRLQVVWVFGLLGLLLYPMALGFGPWDPYRNGFAPTWLLGLSAALALWCWWRRNWLGVLLLAGATAAYAFGLKESGNYWDYLLDPFLVTYCWLVLAAHGLRTLGIGKSRAGRGQDRLNV